MYHLALRLCLATALVLLGAGAARSEFVQFTYSWFAESTYASAPDGTEVHTTFYEDSVPTSAEVGATTPVPLAKFVVSTSGGPPTGPSLYNVAFVYELNLRDLASGQQGHAEVIGRLQGTLGYDTSTLTLSFPDEPLTLRAGDHLYQIHLASVAVAPWNARDAEMIPQLTVKSVPEPSGLALSAVAVLGLAARRFLRRRRGRGA